MAVNYVYSEDYTGPRYTYYSPLRPMPAYMLPHGTTIVVIAGQEPRLVVTTKPLPQEFVEQASLEVRS